jgi:tetraacyldisaccharide 4'-kinase
VNLNTKGFINYLILPVSAIFYALFKIRCFFYKVGLFKTHKFNTPIVIVGNITVGGTGKTPIVMALIKYFKQQNKRVGVVSRGYGGKHTNGSLLVDKNTDVNLSGDESLLIATVSNVPVMVNKNRVQAVKDLINQHQVDLIISDDGLQHYAMGRAVEIAVIDGKRRFGNGFYLPAGPLREPLSRLKSVDFILNNGASVNMEFGAELIPKVFINVKTKETKSLDFFKDKYCHSVAGIGHPQRFFDTLQKLGIKLKKHKFADHHPYKIDDLAFNDNYPIIMTAKDCVKCSQFATDKMWYLQVECELNKTFLQKLNKRI